MSQSKCPHCGAPAAAAASACEYCGATWSVQQPAGTQIPSQEVPDQDVQEPPVVSNTGNQPGAPIPSYMIQAILITFCCCIPFGIVAIIFASRVDGLVKKGDYIEARACSDKAKMWCWIGFGLGLVCNSFAFFAEISQ